MHAVEPNATELYVNVRCLQRGTFVTKPSPVKDKPTVLPTAATLHPDTSLDLAASTAATQEHSNEDDPLFTVTAASSISKSFSSSETTDYGDDRSSTGDLEQVAYRLRKALSPNTSRCVRERSSSEDDEETSSDSFIALEQDAPTMPASAANPDGDTNLEMIGSFMNVPSAAATSLVHNHRDTDAATGITASISFQESVSSVYSTDEAREQLRRFMGKHVTPAAKNSPS